MKLYSIILLAFQCFITYHVINLSSFKFMDLQAFFPNVPSWVLFICFIMTLVFVVLQGLASVLYFFWCYSK